MGGPIGRSGKYVKFAAASDVGAEVAGGVIVAREYAGQIQEIKDHPGYSDEQKAEKIQQVYKQAMLHGGAMFLGHAAGNVAARVSQAGASTRLDPTIEKGQVSVIHNYVDGKRQIEVVHGAGANQTEIQIHGDVAKELAKNQGLYGIAYRNLLGEHSYKPDSRGEEVFLEVKKHEQLVSHYQAVVQGGQTELAPRLEQLELDLAVFRRVESVVLTNPSLAKAKATGEIDASSHFKGPPVTSEEARAAFEPVDGKFESFTEYKLAARADWKPMSDSTYELEGITVTTDGLGRPKTVSGEVDPDRKVGRISGKDTELGQQAGAVKDDIGFHLGADQLGFMGGTLNVVPGNKQINNSEYKSLENDLRGYHDAGHKVEVEFEAVYSLGNTSSRPDGFRVEYTLDGGPVRLEKFNNAGKSVKR